MKGLFVILMCLAVSILFSVEKIEYLPEEEAYFISITRKPEPLRKIPVNVTVITYEEAKKLGATTVAEAIDRFESVDISKYSGLGSLANVRLRNSTAKQVSILINGVPHEGFSYTATDLSELPIEDVERIEIIRGPTSALYGANAVGGIVNVITKKAKQTRTEAGINIGSFNTGIYKVSYEGKHKNVGIHLLSLITHSTSYKPNNDYGALNLSAKVDVDLQKLGKVDLYSSYLNSEFGCPGSIQWPTPTNRQLKENFLLQLCYEKEFEDIIVRSIKLSSFHTDKSLQYRSPDSTSTTKFKNTGLGTNLEFQYNTSLGFGLNNEAYERKAVPAAEEIPRKVVSNYNVFAQYKLIYKFLTTYLGLRYDYNTLFGGKINPYFSSTLDFHPYKFSLSAAMAHRAPTFLDLYWPSTTWVRGNPELKPETSNGIDIGFEFSGGGTRLAINGFGREVKDQIRWYPGPDFVWMPSNVDKAIATGIELSIWRKITDRLSFSFNSSYVYNRVFKKGEEDKGYQLAAYSPQYTTNLSLEYIIPFVDIITVFDSEYVSEQYEMDGKAGNRLAPYTILNLRFGRKVGPADLYLELRNLTDITYQTRYGYPLPGSSYYGGIKVSF